MEDNAEAIQPPHALNPTRKPSRALAEKRRWLPPGAKPVSVMVETSVLSADPGRGLTTHRVTRLFGNFPASGGYQGRQANSKSRFSRTSLPFRGSLMLLSGSLTSPRDNRPAHTSHFLLWVYGIFASFYALGSPVL